MRTRAAWSALLLLGAFLDASPRQFRLVGESNFTGVTASLQGWDVVLIPRADGVLQDALNQGQTLLDFTNGVYQVEIFRENSKVTRHLVLSNDRQYRVEIPYKVTVAPADPGRAAHRLQALDVRGVERKPDAARKTLTAEDARLTPGSGGDVVRTVANQPGVSKTSGFSAGMFIRGGEVEDSLFTYDAIRIGNPFHHVGFYSTFAPASIESLSFYPGTAPLRFSGQGAVMEILSKTRYDKRKPVFDVDVSLAAAGAYASVPLTPTLQLSGSYRRSYYEALFGLLTAIPTVATIGGGILTTFSTVPFFWDASAKLDWSPTREDSLSLVMIGSQDLTTFDGKQLGAPNGAQLGFEDTWTAVGAVWTHESFKVQNRFTVSRYADSNTFSEFEKLFNLPSVPSSLESWAINDTGYWKVSRSFGLEFGADFTVQSYPFSSNTFTVNPGLGLVENLQALAKGTNLFLDRPVRNAVGAHVGGEFFWGDAQVNAGARVLYDSVSGRSDVDPRLGLNWRLGNGGSLYWRGGKYAQLTPLYQASAVFGTPSLLHPFTWQTAVGAAATLGLFQIRSELYGTSFQNIVVPNPATGGAVLTNGAQGDSLGIDLSIRKNIGPEGLLAMLNYGFNQSRRTYWRPDTRQWTWAPFRRQVEHMVNLTLAQVLIPRRLTLALRTSFTSGNPYTPQTVAWDATSGRLVFRENDVKFTDVTPPRFMLDLRAEYSFPLPGKGQGSVYLDLWNLQYLAGVRNVAIYSFDAGVLNPSNPRYRADLREGDAAPVLAVNDLPILPILGLKMVW